MANYNISHPEVMKSVWFVVEAVNRMNEFSIQYPLDSNIQQRIAHEFAAVSGVGFSNCVCSIDGLLLWIEKPSDKEVKRSGLGQKISL